MTFEQLGLNAPILNALREMGYHAPSPIQEKAIPPALAGRDVLGCAQTGTGKTCAFATPILQRLSAQTVSGHPIRALVLTPTRELAIQIGESFEAYGKYLSLRHAVIFGGVGQNPQVEALRRGVDILVATPGRLMDLHDQGFVSLDDLDIFVLDEADRMLDMGFIHDVKKILKWLPRQKQTLFFSATMPPEIGDLVNSLLHDPARVAVDPISSPVEAIEQSVYFVDKNNKTRLLAHLMGQLGVKNALVFTRTKHGANKVARDLEKAGVSAAAIHGNKSQTARQQALSDFKAGNIRCLVATDIAARGLDIEELSHVFNYNLPEVPETYVHRIGRTGRAGRGGQAIAFCDFGEKPLLRDIEKLIGKQLPVVEDHPYPMEVFEAPKRDKHGRIVNEEDQEARAAAREKRRARDEAAKAAAKEKRQAQQEQQAQAVEVLEQAQPSTKKRRRRGRGKAQAQVESAETVQVMEPEVEARQPVREKRPRRGVRSGTLMDTGDAMPRTEFHRPNPLDSDVIMDATARLLAPRALTLGGQEQSRRSKRKKPAHKSQERSAQTQRAPKQQPAAQEDQNGKAGKNGKSAKAAKGEKNARQGRKDRTAPREKRSRGGYQRGLPPEPHRQQKDSTEQPSLMKPFYINVGR